jgi:hypothetical protein
MGPTIILDKSSLQALSFDEIVILNNLYFVNITPVLVMEILGDLKKKSPDGMSKQQVRGLAKKLPPTDSAVIANYVSVLSNDLLGFHEVMDGRPFLDGGQRVIDESGKRGTFFEESPEEQAVRRWRHGDFSAAEARSPPASRVYRYAP